MANHQSLPQHGKPSPTLSLMLKEFTEKNLRRLSASASRKSENSVIMRIAGSSSLTCPVRFVAVFRWGHHAVGRLPSNSLPARLVGGRYVRTGTGGLLLRYRSGAGATPEEHACRWL